jgi:copper chaperone CopZ
MMKKRIIFYTLLMCLIGSLTGMAQFRSAVVGVDGLTCSACAFATEKSLLKLDVIDSVFMQLEENTATVFFKERKKIDMNAVAKKITDAGFSVRNFIASVEVGQLTVKPDYCWTYENDTYHFIKLNGDKELKGLVQLLFIGDKFMPSKEFKKWKLYCKNACTPGTTPAPYSKDYYVTIP